MDLTACLSRSKTRRYAIYKNKQCLDSDESFGQIALLEWSLDTENLSTVSIHTYERAPQLVSPNLVCLLQSRS